MDFFCILINRVFWNAGHSVFLLPAYVVRTRRDRLQVTTVGYVLTSSYLCSFQIIHYCCKILVAIPHILPDKVFSGLALSQAFSSKGPFLNKNSQASKQLQKSAMSSNLYSFGLHRGKKFLQCTRAWKLMCYQLCTHPHP